MSSKVRKILIAVLGVVLIISAGYFYNSSTEEKKEAKEETVKEENTVEEVEEVSIQEFEETPTVITLGNTYQLNDYNLGLYKITTGDLACIAWDGTSIKADDGFNYVDIILNVTNNKDEKDVLNTSTMLGYFMDDDYVLYDDMEYYVEKEGVLTKACNIEGRTTLRMHIACQIPNDITSGKVLFKIDHQVFEVDYNSNQTISNIPSLSINQSVTSNECTLTVSSYAFGANTYGDPVFNSTYDESIVSFIINLTITNNTSTQLYGDDIVHLNTTFGNQYTYDTPDDMYYINEQNYSLDYSNKVYLEPNETRVAVLVYRIPKEYQNESISMLMYFGYNEYNLVY